MRNTLLTALGYLAGLCLMPVYLVWRAHERRMLSDLPRCGTCGGVLEPEPEKVEWTQSGIVIINDDGTATCIPDTATTEEQRQAWIDDVRTRLK